jgi:hypothetical protein
MDHPAGQAAGLAAVPVARQNAGARSGKMRVIMIGGIVTAPAQTARAMFFGPADQARDT